MSARPVALSAQCTALRAPSSRSSLVVRPQRASRALLARGRGAPLPPRAAAEKEGTKEDAKLEVPDAAPAKDTTAAQPAAEVPASSGSDSEAERLSAEDIGAQISQLRAAAKDENKKEGMVEGVLEEVQLIKWPTPQSALLNTLLVVAIVGGTSAVLFGVNTLLAEASRVVYGAL